MFVNILILSVFKFLTLFENNKQLRKLLSVLIFILFCCLTLFRDNIGNDFSTYIYEASTYINGRKQWDFSFLNLRSTDGYELSWYFAMIFCNFIGSSYGVILFYGIISCVFLGLLIKEKKIGPLGVYFLILLGFHFMLWDQIRQGTSLLILLYAICKENKNKYFFFLFAISFHLTSIIIIFLIFIPKIKYNFRLIYLIIILIILIYDLNYKLILDFFQIYSIEDFASYKFNLESDIYSIITTKDYYYRKILFSIPIIILFYNKKYVIKQNELLILFIGTIIWLLGSGSLNFVRLGNYLIMYSIVQLVARNYKKNNFKLFVELPLVFLLLFNIITGSLTQGSAIYYSIFNIN